MPANRIMNNILNYINKINKHTNWNIIIFAFVMLLLIFQTTTYVIDQREKELTSIPVTEWFKVTQFHIPDIVIGTSPEDIVIDYQREIYTDLDGTWNARAKLFFIDNGRFTDVCGASGGVGYNPSATLPEPVTWAWLMDDESGRCLNRLRVGSTYINVITWTFIKDNYPRKTYRVASNPYTMLPSQSD